MPSTWRLGPTPCPVCSRCSGYGTLYLSTVVRVWPPRARRLPVTGPLRPYRCRFLEVAEWKIPAVRLLAIPLPPSRPPRGTSILSAVCATPNLRPPFSRTPPDRGPSSYASA